MSSILDYTEPLSSSSNIVGGLDIVGFEDTQNNLRGTDQSDSITGGGLDDIIQGGAGFDFINGEEGDDVIKGGAGNDVISGDAGDDLIKGDAGDDVIKGGAGKDNLFGGEGKDTFVLEFFDNADTINDFQVGEDKIEIRGVGADAQVNYDEITGQLSVDGQEIANLQPGLDFSDEDYDIF